MFLNFPGLGQARTSLKFFSKSIHHRDGCIRIRNLCQINNNFCSQSLSERLKLRIPQCNFTSCGDYNVLLSCCSVCTDTCIIKGKTVRMEYFPPEKLVSDIARFETDKQRHACFSTRSTKCN